MRRWSHRLLWLGLASLLALAAAGCTQQAAPAPKQEAAPTTSAAAPTQAAAPKSETKPTAESKPAAKPTVAPKAEAKPVAKADAKPRPPLRTAYVAPIAAMAPLWMGKETGAFDKEGVQVDIKSIQANAAISALFAGDVDLVEISGPAVVTAGLQDPDVVFIAGLLDKMIFSVWTKPEIKSAADLKGKPWGTDRPGTPNDFATQVALDRLGLKRTDVQLLNLGGSDKVIAALLSGQIAATQLTPPADFIAEDKGFHQLMDLYDFPYQNIGMVARRSKLSALEPSIVPFLKGLQQGIDSYNGDKALALKVIQSYTKEEDQKILDKSYEFFRARGFNRKLDVPDKGLQSIIDFLTESLPAAKSAKPDQFYDSRYVKQLS